MLNSLSSHIRLCLERAAEAKQCAEESSDPRVQRDCRQLEDGWNCLAQSFQFAERLERFLLKDGATFVRWQPIDTAPFDRNLELAVITDGEPHALAFACRRILGGWCNANSKERLPLHPTHWRDWEDKL